jgi:hypothetical protein
VDGAQPFHRADNAVACEVRTETELQLRFRAHIIEKHEGNLSPATGRGAALDTRYLAKQEKTLSSVRFLIPRRHFRVVAPQQVSDR